MDQYLSRVKTNLGTLDQFSRVQVVLCNEACDLDSAVSAITYAYYLDQKSQDDSTIVLPVLNIPESQFRLRTETTHFFAKLNVPCSCVIFKDQVDFDALHADGILRLTLVDHNVLTGKDGKFDDCVTSVIDHHVNERVESEQVKVKLEFVGSCSTLIAEELLDDPDFHVDDQVAELLYGTILIDTVNRSPDAGKITLRDEGVLGRLQTIIPNVKGDNLFEDLQAAKFDISGLLNMEILEKDLKMVAGTGMTIAMCSVTMDMQKLLARPNFQYDLADFCASRNSDVVVIMTLGHTDAGKPTRQIAVYSQRRIYKDQIADALDNASDVDLELEPVTPPFNDISVFHQANVKASRKIVMPILKSFLLGDVTPDVCSKDFITQQSISMATEGFSSFKFESEKEADDFKKGKALLDIDLLEPLEPSKSITETAGSTSEAEPSSNFDLLNFDASGSALHDTGQSDAVLDFDLLTLPQDMNTSNAQNLHTVHVQTPSQTPFGHFKTADKKSSAISSSETSTAMFFISGSSELVDDAFISGDDTLNPFTAVSNLGDRTGNVNRSKLSSDFDAQDLLSSDSMPLNSEDEPSNAFLVDIDSGSPVDVENEKESVNTYTKFADTSMDNFDPFGANPPEITEQHNGSDRPKDQTSINPFKIDLELHASEQSHFEDMQESDNPFTVENLSVTSAYGTRPKARKSISLIVEVDHSGEEDNLAELNEADFFDKNPSPEAQNSGNNSPFINSGMTSPFINSAIWTPIQSRSMVHSTRGSESGSDYPPSVATPPHSLMDRGMENMHRDHALPSFNSAEMVERIHKKKASLGGGINILGFDDFGEISAPYTPQNSFRDDSGSFMGNLSLPSLNNSNMVQRVQEKRASLGNLLDFHSADEDIFGAGINEKSNIEGESTNNSNPFINFSDFDTSSGPVPQYNSNNNPFFQIDGEDNFHSSEDFVPFTPANSFVDLGGSYMKKMDSVTEHELSEKLNGIAAEIENQTEPDLLDIFGSSGFTNNEQTSLQTDSQVKADFEEMFGKQSESQWISQTDSKDHTIYDNFSQPIENENEILSNKEIKNSNPFFEDVSESVQNIVDDASGETFWGGMNVEHINEKTGLDLAENETAPPEVEGIADKENIEENIEATATTVSESVPNNADGTNKEQFTDIINVKQAEIDQIENETILHEIEDVAEEEVLEAVAKNVAKEVIQHAVEVFPDLKNPSLAEYVTMEVLEGAQSSWTEQGSGDSGISSSDSPQQGAAPVPKSPRTPRLNMIENQFSVETDYLPSMDPLHGSLNMAMSHSSNTQTIETDADKEVVEGESFRRVSGELILAHTANGSSTYTIHEEKGIKDKIRGMIILENLVESESSLLHENLVENKSSLLHENLVESESSLLHENLVENESSILHEKLVESESSLLHENLVESESSLLHENLVESECSLLHENHVESESSLLHENLVESECSLLHENLVESESSLLHENLVENESSILHENLVESESSLLHENLVESECSLLHENLVENESSILHKDLTESESCENAVKVVGDYEENDKKTSPEMLYLMEAVAVNTSESVLMDQNEANEKISNENAGEDLESIERDDTDVTEALMDSSNENKIQGNDFIESMEDPVVRDMAEFTEHSIVEDIYDISIEKDSESMIEEEEEMALSPPSELPVSNEVENHSDLAEISTEKDLETNSISPDSSNTSFVSTSDSDSELITVRENLLDSHWAEGLENIEEDKTEESDNEEIEVERVEINVPLDVVNVDEDIENGNKNGDNFSAENDAIPEICFDEVTEIAIPEIRLDKDESNNYHSEDTLDKTDITQEWNQTIFDDDSENFDGVSFVNTDLDNARSNKNEDMPLLGASMTESALTIETISPVDTPTDEHATGFYEVNPEVKVDGEEIEKQDLSKSLFGTNLGENETGFYEITPEINSMVQSAITTESVSPVESPSDEHVKGFYEFNDDHSYKEMVYQENNDLLSESSDVLPKIDVSLTESTDTDDSETSDNDGFYAMNAELQGTVLQNIEIGNAFSPVESPNEDQVGLSYEINPLIPDVIREDSENSESDENESVDAKLFESYSDRNTAQPVHPVNDENAFANMADNLVTEAITGAIEIVQDMKFQKDEAYIVTEIADAMADTETGESSDSDSSSTTTEGSYRINISATGSPVNFPETDSFIEGHNKGIHLMTEAVEEFDIPDNSAETDSFIEENIKGGNLDESDVLNLSPGTDSFIEEPDKGNNLEESDVLVKPGNDNFTEEHNKESSLIKETLEELDIPDNSTETDSVIEEHDKGGNFDESDISVNSTGTDSFIVENNEGGDLEEVDISVNTSETGSFFEEQSNGVNLEKSEIPVTIAETGSFFEESIEQGCQEESGFEANTTKTDFFFEDQNKEVNLEVSVIPVSSAETETFFEEHNKGGTLEQSNISVNSTETVSFIEEHYKDVNIINDHDVVEENNDSVEDKENVDPGLIEDASEEADTNVDLVLNETDYRENTAVGNDLMEDSNKGNINVDDSNMEEISAVKQETRSIEKEIVKELMTEVADVSDADLQKQETHSTEKEIVKELMTEIADVSNADLQKQETHSTKKEIVKALMTEAADVSDADLQKQETRSIEKEIVKELMTEVADVSNAELQKQETHSIEKEIVKELMTEVADVSNADLQKQETHSIEKEIVKELMTEVADVSNAELQKQETHSIEKEIVKELMTEVAVVSDENLHHEKRDTTESDNSTSKTTDKSEEASVETTVKNDRTKAELFRQDTVIPDIIISADDIEIISNEELNPMADHPAGEKDKSKGGDSGYTTRKEIFYTSAGRMSISIDSVADPPSDSDQVYVSQEYDIIHEAHEISNAQVTHILARANSVVGHADEIISRLSESTLARLQELYGTHASTSRLPHLDLDTMSLCSEVYFPKLVPF